MKSMVGKLRYAVDKCKMINDNDKIVVGVSGGKDSLTLLSLLVELKRYYPYKYEILAASVDPCFFNKETDFSEVLNFCKTLDVDYVVIRTKISEVVFEHKQNPNPCSLCSRMRNGILHNVAVQRGFNKIAIGHNLDDVVETFFMNLLNGGRIKCFSPISYLSRKDLWLIRPLIFCSEQEIKSFAKKSLLPVIKSPCPVDGKTQRQKTKDLIKFLEHDYKALKQKVLNAIIKSNVDDWGEGFTI